MEKRGALLDTFVLFVQGLDFVVDGGVRVADPSTVVDMMKIPPRVVRQGKVAVCHLTCYNFKMDGPVASNDTS